MFKRLSNKIAVSVLIAQGIFFCGCNEFLDEVPDNRTEIDSPEKVSELLVGAYPGASYFSIAESMSDNAMDVGPVFNQVDDINRAMYFWEDTNLEDQDTPIEYWNACYKAIAQANYALRAIDELGGGAEMNPQKGEALVARAYAHFMLVNLWAKAYNPDTAGQDLGVPYVTEPETEVIKDYKRISVQEVYDLIERDLLEGMKLIKNNYEEPKFHFTKEAAAVFASRFYLVLGKWNEVVKYSSQVLRGGASTSNLRDWAYLNSLSPEETEIQYASSSQATNLLIVPTLSWYSRNYGYRRYGLTDNLSRLIFQDDPTDKGWLYRIRVYTTSGLNFVTKYDEHFVYTNLNARIGYGYSMNVLFTHDEALLNRIEANIMLGNKEVVAADLNAFLSKRISGYDPETDVLTYDELSAYYSARVEAGEYDPFYTIDADKLPLIKCVEKCRQREFMHEGIRWLDTKRLGMEIIHEDYQGNQHVLTKDDPRRQLQIPQIAQNLGLEPNPR
ncbi:RagB/SusD family nutrient uptake outer membrane protein [Galbibacter sp. PAP.153]|uniref:RagB/SusD family nutrient uptake outer membrane protein n=1 Tax=Galbibacter sp. PAP.153 TaxID=3104623 RepID=UPI003009B9D5